MKVDHWNSKIGVILAVSGSAVGLGNFLKFPGQVATYGGASFMIAYVLSFILLGIPIAIVEWTSGRDSGSKGFNSPGGILGAFYKSKKMAYVGIIGASLTLIIYCYYIYIEAWCLGYAYNFLSGALNFSNVDDSSAFFYNFIGVFKNGSAFELSTDKVFIFLVVSFFLNFYMIYRGVSKGIEFFCKYAMPTLLVLALVIVIRMMTLTDVSPEHPERTINQGLGFMWNPVKVVLEEKIDNEWVSVKQLVGDMEISAQEKLIAEQSASDPQERIVYISLLKQLMNPSIWIAAAGQVFFSLTVGFGAIMTYASYLRKNDDIVLSSLTSASANEFCEVCLGGLITVPAAVAFFGVSGILGAGMSLFDLGFKVLPLFFASIPMGWFFGFLFFFLLFLAAVTSSLSMLQPSMAFIEESMRLPRKLSTLLLSLITFFIIGFVVYCSKDLKALDTFDFWVGQVIVYSFAMIQVIAFSWWYGAKKGVMLANEGSLLKLPVRPFAFILKFVTPPLLVILFVFWLAQDVFGIMGDGKVSPYISDLFGNEPNLIAWSSVMIFVAVHTFLMLVIFSSRSYDDLKEGR